MGLKKWYNVTARSRFPHQQLSVSEILKQPTIILLSHRCERRLKGFSHVLTVLTFHLEKGVFKCVLPDLYFIFFIVVIVTKIMSKIINCICLPFR